MVHNGVPPAKSRSRKVRWRIHPGPNRKLFLGCIYTSRGPLEAKNISNWRHSANLPDSGLSFPVPPSSDCFSAFLPLCPCAVFLGSSSLSPALWIPGVLLVSCALRYKGKSCFENPFFFFFSMIANIPPLYSWRFGRLSTLNDFTFACLFCTF